MVNLALDTRVLRVSFVQFLDGDGDPYCRMPGNCRLKLRAEIAESGDIIRESILVYLGLDEFLLSNRQRFSIKSDYRRGEYAYLWGVSRDSM